MNDCLEAFVLDSLRRPMSQHELLESLEADLAKVLSRLVLLGRVVEMGTMPERFILTSHQKAPVIAPDALREGWHSRPKEKGGGSHCTLCGVALTDANTFPSQRGKSRRCKYCTMRAGKAKRVLVGR